MKKTLREAGEDFFEAWHDFVLAFCYALKIDRLCKMLEHGLQWLTRHLSGSEKDRSA